MTVEQMVAAADNHRAVDLEVDVELHLGMRSLVHPGVVVH